MIVLFIKKTPFTSLLPGSMPFTKNIIMLKEFPEKVAPGAHMASKMIFFVRIAV